MKKIARLGATALAVALVATGCTAGDPPGESTLYVYSADTEVSFDPATDLAFPSTWAGLVNRRLTTWSIGPDSIEIVPDLATDTGTPNADGTVWTYTLKDDIFFEDGTPITSQHIKFGVERTFAPELAGGLTYHTGLLVGGESYTGPYDGGSLDAIETPDDKTIVFHLNAASGDWPWFTAMNAFVPVPEDASNDGSYGDQPLASGPYRVESNVDGTETVLVRNEEWRAETDEVRTADPDRIVIKQSQNPSTVVQSLIADTGEGRTAINSFPLGAAELALVHADPAAEERLTISDGGILYYVALNVDREELSDVRVRQAVQHAVDREAIVLALGGSDVATPATSMIPPGIAGHEDYDLYPRDVEKAKALLAEAGYPDGIELDLWVMADDAAFGEALQQGLAEAGITVNILALDGGVMYGDAMGGNPDYDLFFSYWIPDYPAPASALALLFDSAYIDGGFNLSRLDDAEIDAAMAGALATTDIDSAVSQWSGIDRAIMEQASVVPIYMSRSAFLRGSGVEAFSLPAYPAFHDYLTISLSE
jgi:peptide/nickel transport system substrate-binding protein